MNKPSVAKIKKYIKEGLLPMIDDVIVDKLTDQALEEFAYHAELGKTKPITHVQKTRINIMIQKGFLKKQDNIDLLTSVEANELIEKGDNNALKNSIAGQNND